MKWYFAGALTCLVVSICVKQRTKLQKIYYQASLVLAAAFLLAAIVGMADGEEKKNMQIARNEPGQGTKEKEFVVDIAGEMESYPLNLEILEKKLTKAQRRAYLENAKEELDLSVLGENPSKDTVSKALFLPDYLQGGAVEASYRFSDYDIFHGDGTIRQEPLEPTVVEVTAELTCQEEASLYQFPICVVPREKSLQEQLSEKLKAMIAKQNEQENAAYVKLPDELEGKEVTWRENTVNRSFIVIFLGLAVAVGMFLREKEDEKRERIKRERQMMIDYPDIVGKFSLLLGAGMNIPFAWEKIALAYQKKRECGEIDMRFAYEEMLGTLYEIRDGIGELQAYENFGNRCQLSIYRRFSALIVQNVRKGSQGMQKLLEQEEWEAYEQRKAHARRLGEEAGTKLLLPMGTMLAIVLAILVIPAGMALNV